MVKISNLIKSFKIKRLKKKLGKVWEQKELADTLLYNNSISFAEWLKRYNKLMDKKDTIKLSLKKLMINVDLQK